MLKGPRLTLRAVTRDDLPRYVAWLNDTDVVRHLSMFMPMNLDDETEWYEAQRKDRSTLNLAMETETGQHIGSVGLMSIDYRNQSAELGIVIGEKNEWNKGYGGEAIEILLAYAFNELNLNRIYLRVDTDNLGGVNCYKRCGFVTEGEFREVGFRDGKYINQYIMSVLRNEYRQRH